LPVFFLLYYAVTESSRLQATFGKKTLGLQVTNLSEKRISFLRALVRAPCKILSLLSFFSLGILVMFLDPKKRTFHDRITETLIVKTEE